MKPFLSGALNIDNNIEFYSGTAPKTFKGDWNKHKRRVQQRFKANEFPLLVSTKAFGMGIDKPNIRYTIHYGIPQSLEAFYQEAGRAGRAGRDGKDSICAIIFSDDSAAHADLLLDVNRNIEEKLKPPWKKGDIHRLMYFHEGAFQGACTEKQAILELLEGWIYPCLKGLKPNQSKEIQIPYEVVTQ